MNELKKLIEECERKGIKDAFAVIRKVLAEQHRNTRHDASEVLLNKAAKANNPLFAFLAVDIEQDIMNLKQRSPLSQQSKTINL